MADEFIDHLASKSSLTGQEYQLKFSDGRTIPAGEYLHEELEELEADR